MVSTYQLRPGIAHCRFEECGIVLDLNADRYWQVSGRLALVLDWVAGKAAAAIAPSDLHRLESLGLAVRASALVPASSRPVLPRPSAGTDQLSATGCKPRLRLACPVMWHAAKAWAAVRCRPLSALATRVERRRRASRAPDRAIDLATLAASFQRYRRWLPMAPVCLADSLAFLELAARYGHHPNLVFGVVAAPFTAHCWVQADTMICTDVLDHASLFSPILIV